MIVADAMHCQKETAKIIIEGKGDYLLNVKGNQSELKRNIEEYVQDKELRKTMEREEHKEKNRNRIETRTALVTGDIQWLYGKEKWRNIACIGAIKTEFKRNDNKKEEWHYYISSRQLTAAELLRHARMEWTVETMHWLLDVHYTEDFCRIISKTTQENLNMLRKISLGLIKQYKANTNSKRAMSKIMFDCMLNPDTISEVISGN